MIAGLVSGSAFADIYECVENGKRLFSDVPCPSGALGAVVPETAEKASSPVASPSENLDRAKKNLDEIVRDRRLREIDAEIERGEEAIRNNIALMEKETASIQEESHQIDNRFNILLKHNLALKMRGVVAKHRTINNDLKNRVVSLRAKRESIVPERTSDDAQGLSGELYRAQRERRLNSIDTEVAYNQREIQRNQTTMEAEVAQLRNELEGIDSLNNASWKFALLEEIRAVSEKYQLMNSALEGRIDTLIAERSKLLQ
ncbi:MAG: DUF4124 domain-containing protein [Candidatus Accumulibacter sp.]|nr:DUF4124 domain-containing protein [Accumulibacter sp.]